MAAVDYFLKIDGIPGESPDAKHKDEIQLESWAWGESQSGTFAAGGGGGAGKVAMQDFQFTMRMNKASPKLMLACAKGDHVKSALLTCRKAGGDQQEYLKIQFDDLLIASYHTGGSEGSGIVPVDAISFNFAKIKFEYAPQDAKGKLGSPVITNWDLKLNKGG